MTVFDEVCNDFKINDKDKKELSKLIKDKNCITEIDFWTSYYFNKNKKEEPKDGTKSN